MSVTVNDTILSNSPKSLDAKYLKLGLGVYSSTSDVNSSILSAYRSRGLTVNILGVEYWYRDTTLDADLVQKTLSFNAPLVTTGAAISLPNANASTNGYLSQGDWIVFNNKLSSVAATGSITNLGTSGNPLSLINDNGTPGSSKLYGTDSSGIKGWYPIPVSSGGGPTPWGGITGSLSSQTDLVASLATKEPVVTVGTVSQYYRGDKTFQALTTDAVVEGSTPYFTVARARAAISAGTGITYNSSTGVITSTSTTFLYTVASATGSSDFSMTASNYVVLSDLTGQANRNITLPTSPTTGQAVIIENNNSSTFDWTFIGTVKDLGNNTITTLTGLTIYYLVYNGSVWRIVN